MLALDVAAADGGSGSNLLTGLAVAVALVVGLFTPIVTIWAAGVRQREMLDSERRRLDRQLAAERSRALDALEYGRLGRWEERVLDLCGRFLDSTSQTVRLISIFAGEKADRKQSADATRAQFDEQRQVCRLLAGQITMLAPTLAPSVEEMFEHCVQPLRTYAYERHEPDLRSSEWDDLHQETRRIRARFVEAVRRELAGRRLKPESASG